MQLARSRSDSLGAEGSDRLTLDVGGTLYKTSLKTLLKGGSFFAERLHQLKMTTLFIDRNPESFGHILDLMRGYPLALDTMSPTLRAKVEADLVYYKLGHLAPEPSSEFKK